jgi:hypothetical protein
MHFPLFVIPAGNLLGCPFIALSSHGWDSSKIVILSERSESKDLRLLVPACLSEGAWGFSPLNKSNEFKGF